MTISSDFNPESHKEQLLLLASKALEHWGLQKCKLHLIKHRENAVYRVATADGEQHVLRIHRSNYHTDASLRSEMQWMAALAQGKVEVPRIIPTITGDLFARVSMEEIGDSRQVDLLEWIDGEQLGSMDNELDGDNRQIKKDYNAMGEVAAMLHNHATTWALPEGFSRHAWDVEGLLGEDPFWGRFWELGALTSKQRALIEHAREQARQDLLDYGQSPQTYSLIHADFLPENFLVEGEKIRIIDFDDAGFGWHLFDLATALYFIQDEPLYLVAHDALIDGYLRHRPLAGADLARLPLFLTVRGFTYLGWLKDRKDVSGTRDITGNISRACVTAERYLAQR